ncbi:MAG TPA: A/G-specific adenine glycosylase [Acidimicrobiales bacterium]|nr:A/G-specific adenine glycosylase [Acidimicrobiales bacterium]
MERPGLTPAARATVQEAVLGWWAEGGGGRELPWRATRDPWAVLVSEVMLQQTQASRVASRWPAFLEAFPTPAACAAAGVAEVLRAWSGLGYNRRAVALHRAAVVTVAQHGGRLPADLPGLLALPGVGPYTARAVLAFAGGVDVGVLDANVARVLARCVAGAPLSAAAAQRLADELVPRGRGWDWNQALVDLGATRCTTSSPSCAGCPVAGVCSWRNAPAHDGSDPARGSAGTSGRQSTFAGSDRQGRGRLVEALRAGPVPEAGLDEAMGWPGQRDRVARVAKGLVAEGLVARVVPDGGDPWFTLA